MNNTNKPSASDPMPHSQTADIVLRLAMGVEEEGAVFYRKMAKMAPNQAVKEIFLSLAEDEMRHKNDLAKIAGSLQDQAYAFSINFAGIMHASVDTLKRSMKESEPLETDALDLSKALDIGIRNEKSAIQVYTNLADVFPPALVKVLTRIIDEEKGHLSKLLRIKGARLA
jgi:rubrerythrin